MASNNQLRRGLGSLLGERSRGRLRSREMVSSVRDASTFHDGDSSCRTSIVTFSLDGAWKLISNLDFTTRTQPAPEAISESLASEPAWSQRPDGLKGRLTSSLIYNRNNKSSRKDRRRAPRANG